MLVSCLYYSSNLKMEVTCSSETLVDFQQFKVPYITEEGPVKSRNLVGIQGGWRFISKIILIKVLKELCQI
jgi:hypothetical protein